MSAGESAAVPAGVGSRGHARHSGHDCLRPDANEKHSPDIYRVFKTLCFFVSFGTMVR